MLKLPICLLLLVLFTGACTSPDAGESAPGAADIKGASQDPFHLFLLAGQSNMAGRGVVDEASTTPHPNVFALNQQGVWAPAIDPIHFDKPVAGVGPGKAFGEAIAAAYPGMKIGLIPAAVGGSPIASWEPGALDPATGTHPYDDALAQARRAMEDGQLKAILWHQGESDSHPDRSPVYREKLVALINRFRTDLGNAELPFFIGQLGRFDTWSAAKKEVDAAHQSIAAAMAGVYFVDADGLDHKGDSLHFSTAAARALGARYAAAYLDHPW